MTLSVGQLRHHGHAEVLDHAQKVRIRGEPLLRPGPGYQHGHPGVQVPDGFVRVLGQHGEAGELMLVRGSDVQPRQEQGRPVLRLECVSLLPLGVDLLPLGVRRRGDQAPAVVDAAREHLSLLSRLHAGVEDQHAPLGVGEAPLHGEGPQGPVPGGGRQHRRDIRGPHVAGGDHLGPQLQRYFDGLLEQLSQLLIAGLILNAKPSAHTASLPIVYLGIVAHRLILVYSIQSKMKRDTQLYFSLSPSHYSLFLYSGENERSDKRAINIPIHIKEQNHY